MLRLFWRKKIDKILITTIFLIFSGIPWSSNKELQGCPNFLLERKYSIIMIKKLCLKLKKVICESEIYNKEGWLQKDTILKIVPRKRIGLKFSSHKYKNKQQQSAWQLNIECYKFHSYKRKRYYFAPFSPKNIFVFFPPHLPII